MPDQSAASPGPEESQATGADVEVLDDLKDELGELRAQIAKERDDRLRKEAGLSSAVEYVALSTERERLLTELANERALSNKVEGSSDKSLDTAEAAMRLAVAQRDGVDELQKVEAKAAADAAPNPLTDESSFAEAVPPAANTPAVATPTPKPAKPAANATAPTGKEK